MNVSVIVCVIVSVIVQRIILKTWEFESSSATDAKSV